MVVPAIVPPGRKDCGSKRLRTRQPRNQTSSIANPPRGLNISGNSVASRRSISAAVSFAFSFMPLLPTSSFGYNARATCQFAPSAGIEDTTMSAHATAKAKIPPHKTAAGETAASSLLLLREDTAGVAILTLNDPETRNSLSEAMLEALGDALTAIAHDKTMRAVVLA